MARSSILPICVEMNRAGNGRRRPEQPGQLWRGEGYPIACASARQRPGRRTQGCR